MNKIQLFFQGDLRNAEHYQFLSDTNNDIIAVTPELLSVEKVYPLFIAAFKKEEEVLKIEVGSAKSVVVKEDDKLRDLTWKSGWHRIESALCSPFPEEVESGKALKRIFNVYGDIRNHPQNQESGEMTNLVNDLLKPENATHLQIVNMVRLIPELGKENDAFILAVNNRDDDLSGRESGDTKAARLEVDIHFNEMVDIINATVTLKLAKPAAESFITKLNKRIEVYKTTLTARDTINHRVIPPKAAKED